MNAYSRLPLSGWFSLGLLALGGCITSGDDGTGDDSGLDTADTADTADTGITVLDVVVITEDITTDTTWTADHVYRIDTTIDISATLTLEPGTIVKLGEGLGIVVGTGGRILHAGDADHRCLFTAASDDTAAGDSNADGTLTSPAPGAWASVVVWDSGSVFDYCELRYGGANAPYSGTLMIMDEAAVTVTNSWFHHNQGGTPEDTRAAAFNAGAAGVGTVVHGDTFWKNGLPLVIGPSIDIDDSMDFHFTQGGDTLLNDYPGIFWGGSYEIVGDRSWTNTDAPFVIAENPLAVPEGGSLTLGAGTTVKFAQDRRLDIEGALLATDVVFTSIHDQSDGVDTLGDLGDRDPAPGDWGSIGINTSATVLEGCTIQYAGAGMPYVGAMFVRHDAEPTLEANTFVDNAGGTFEDARAAALNLGAAGAGVVVTDNVFYGNGMPMVINGIVSLDDSNTFTTPVGDSPPNVYNVIEMDGTSHAVEAVAVWQETEVPFVLFHTTLSVKEGAMWQLGDGVIVKSEEGRVDVMGSVQEGLGVAYTSLRDDARLGDSNADGSATTPAHGDWSGVNLCLDGCEWATWGNIYYAEYP